MFDKKFRMLVKKTKYKTNLFYMNKGIWLIRKFLNPEEVFSLTNIFTDKNKNLPSSFYYMPSNNCSFRSFTHKNI